MKNSFEHTIRETKVRYFEENPNATIKQIKVLKSESCFSWYKNLTDTILDVWSEPDKLNSSVHKCNVYFVTNHPQEWMYVLREDDIKFI